MRSDNHFTALLAAVLISSLCFVAFAQPTFADSPPVPQKKIDALTSIDYKNFTQKNIRKCSTDITKMREDVKRNYSHLDRAISKVVSRKIIFESEDPGLDEIIN